MLDIHALHASCYQTHFIRPHFSLRQRKYKQKFTTQGRKEGSTDQPTERPTYIIINFKFYCICTLFKTNSDVIILSRVFQRVLGQCQEGWLFWIAETTSKDGQEGWLNINIVNKEFPETLLTVSQIVFVWHLKSVIASSVNETAFLLILTLPCPF